jgi:hypothetical protein
MNFLRCVAVISFALLQFSCGSKDQAMDPSGGAPGSVLPRSGMYVTFDVGGQSYRALITRPSAMNHVLSFARGESSGKIPNAPLLRGGDFNSPWSWHVDGSRLEFADFTIEACDGTPQQVEEELDRWIEQIQRFCPWSARITEALDCRSGQCATLVLRSGGTDGA